MIRPIEKLISRLTGGRRRLLRTLPAGSAGAEIGVWQGDFSNLILETVQPKQLHLVDPWSFQPEFPDRLYGGKEARSQGDMDAIFEATKARLSAYDNIQYWRMSSDEFFKKFEGQLDWIYIDGNHFYDWVKRDIENALRVVRPGGFVCGDDYHWNVDGREHVKDAVHDVLQGRDLVLKIINEQFRIEL